MSPPIYTPDGSEVSEIVLPDGSTASEVIGPDGSVVFEAGPDIPDSENLHASYIVSEQPELNGQTINPLVDQQNGYNAAASASPTMDIDGFNNNPAAVCNQSEGDHWTAPTEFGSVSQPFTVYSVVDLSSSANTSETYTILDESADSSDRTIMRWNGGSWSIWAGNNFVSGTSDETKNLITGVYDGPSSAIYEDETQQGTGDVGSNSISVPNICTGVGANLDLWDGGFVELHVYDGAHDSSTRSDVWSWIKTRTF